MDVGHENKGYDKKDVEQGDLDLNIARANQVKLSFKKDGPVKRRTKCEKGLIFLLVIFILVVIALVVVVLVQKNKIDDDKSVKNDVTATKKPEICQTADCAQASARLIASMDLSVDPCEDFYEFSCGLWRKKTVIPEASSFYGTLSEVYDDIQVTNKYLLEDMTSYQGIPAITKAKDMYTSCVNVDRIEEKGSSVAIPLLEELGGWPILGTGPGGNWSENEFSLSKLLISLHQYNNFPVIGMFVGYDDRESNKNIIHLDQPSLGLPGRLYYLQENLSEMREAYVTFASSVAQLFGVDQTASERDVQDILALETDIANISTSMEDRRDTTALYNKMSISELRENFTEPTSNDVIQFNWLEYLSGAFDLENVKIAINESEPVVVYDVAYYRKLFSVLQKHGKRTLANYMVWTIMQNRAGNLDSRFQDLKTEFTKVLSGTTAQEARWKTCVSYIEMYFGMALGHMFVKETFDETAKAETLEMIGNIRGTFNDELENIAWMDDATRTVAKEKADAVKEWIGYSSDILIPEKLNKLYENASIDGDEYFKNVLNNLKGVAAHSLRQLRKKFNKNEWKDPPSQVNAFYSAVLNTIIFPAGILQPPLYSKDQPKSMNYGGIGSVIGHELTHGFDDQGRQFDKDGNLRQWWDDSVIEKFKEKSQCLIDQYSKFYEPVSGLNVNGINTQGENIADNGGVKQSYMAYRKWVEQRGSEEPTLPGLNFTNNQLFFINWAQVWCDNTRKQSFINLITTGVHSPERFRVIGSLQNFQNFADEFGCRKNSVMNPETKCSVW